jgi:hypothetical protein
MKVSASGLARLPHACLLCACINFVFADGQAVTNEFDDGVIAHVFIGSATVLQGVGEDKALCGTRYQARIREAYGIEQGNSPDVSFVTGRPLKVGADYLVFVAARSNLSKEVHQCGLGGGDQLLRFPYALEFVDISRGQPSDERSLFVLYDPMSLNIPDGVRTVGRQFRKCESVDALADTTEAENCPLVKLEPAMEWTSLKDYLARRKSDHQ